MPSKKYWIEIMIDLDPSILESISTMLFDIKCSGIEEVHSGFILYFEEGIWNSAKQIELINIIQNAYSEFTPERMKIARIPDENWMEEWKKGFDTYRVTNNLLIKPDWENVEPQKGQTHITIAPKMAFGTGHHESTRLILRLMPDYIELGYNVLDLGTGSGILAIYAAKLGASKVIGVDNDPIALENFEENVGLNHCSHIVQGFVGTIEELNQTKYNLVLANINRNTLMKLPTKLSEKIFPGGYLILSGILISDEKTIKNAYLDKGWKCKKLEYENEWISMVFQHN
jgi:ribosomal protein L11 methyltransferase